MPCPQPDDPAPSDATAPPTNEPTTCVRCKSASAITIFRDSIYCQACALAVFYQKAKTGLEYARGAGLAKYVAAAKSATSTAGTVAESSRTSSSSASSSSPAAANADGTKRPTKQINNGGGNAEVNVSANIAVAFSGGSSSRALLRTATQYFRPESAFVNRDARRRKARGEEVEENDVASISSVKPRGAANAAGRFNEVGKIYVFYIDDSAVIPGGVDRTEEARKMIDEEECPDLHFVGLKLEDVFRSDDGSLKGVPWTLVDVDSQQLYSASQPVSDAKQTIKDLFSALHPSDTPRTGASSARTRIEDLHRILISTLLRRTAQQYDCAALLLGDTATRISIRLIEDLAKGAGHKLPVQGSDAVWIDDLLVVRPFKTHLMQEVLFYTSALGLEQLLPEQHVVPPTVSTGDILENQNINVPYMDKSSIARLTETFILNLEKGVPSTVTTIGKTGSKLVLNDPAASPSTSLEENASRSTSTFQNVGPSVSLRSRQPLADSMSSMTVNEPRIGSRGIKLAQLSAGCLRWSTRHGCALCQMPSQHPKARYWKRDITISTLGDTAPTSRETARNEVRNGTGDEQDWIELSNHLCYACLLVLAPPISAGGIKSMLPASVLHHIQRSARTTDVTDQGNVDGIDGGLDATGHHADAEQEAGKQDGCENHGKQKATPQPLKRSEIKAQIDEFLLDDA